MKDQNLPTVVFSIDDVDYSLTIHDVNGNRWVPSSQVGEALGNTNIRDLMAGLIEKGEIQEGKHYCRLTLHRESDGKLSPHLVLSHRGIIRVSMRSEGSRAIQFRDWAEDVLYEVMTTGRYSIADHNKKEKQISILAPEFKAAIEIAEACGFTGNQAILSANIMMKKVHGENVLELMDKTQLICEIQERHYTATDIGVVFFDGLSGQKINILLQAKGLIKSFRDHKSRLQWQPTEKGKKFCVIKDTGKKYSDGAPIQSIFWIESVVDELKNDSEFDI